MIKLQPAAWALPGVLFGLVGIVWFVTWASKAEAPTMNQNVINNRPTGNVNAMVNAPLLTTEFRTADVPKRDPHLSFTATIPATWAVESISGSQALNFFDAQANVADTLNSSLVFVRYFTAARFLTLTTVDVQSRVESTITGRPAVTYVITKKAGVADFPSQPAWRNTEHTVTDIRSTDESPTTFYVFAKSPTLSQEQFDQFLRSVRFFSAP